MFPDIERVLDILKKKHAYEEKTLKLYVVVKNLIHIVESI